MARRRDREPRGLPRRRRAVASGLPAPRRADVPPGEEPGGPPPGLTPGPSPLTTAQRRFRDLQEEIRLGIWDYGQKVGYNPFFALIDLGRTTVYDEIALACHKEVAQYLLAKLASIRIEAEVEHHHEVTALQVLFAALEAEEATERESMEPWIPPGMAPIDLTQQPSGTWDLEDEGDDEDEDEGADEDEDEPL